MGLSEGRRKQRLVGSAHTRNAAWSNDATLPGQRLLASMGWAAGQGIGRTASGMADPVKVAFKMDNRGIGAQRAEREARASGLADAWIGGNGELGNLFERLNRQDAAASSSSSSVSLLPVVDASADVELDEKSAKKAAKRQRKEEKEQKKADKAAKKASKEAKARNELIAAGPIPARTSALNPRMAARAKYLRAKRMVGSDAASVNEILGIASPSTSGTSSPMPAIQAPAPEMLAAAIESTADMAKAEKKKSKKDKKGKNKAEEQDDATAKDEKKSKKKEKRKRNDAAISEADEAATSSSEKSKKEKKEKKKKRSRDEDASQADDEDATKKKRSKSSQGGDDIPVVPMSAAASQPALPPSSDPSFDAPGGGRVSHLSVQEYLSNKLMLRRAAVVRMRREKEQGVWQRAAAAAVGAN